MTAPKNICQRLLSLQNILQLCWPHEVKEYTAWIIIIPNYQLCKLKDLTTSRKNNHKVVMNLNNKTFNFQPQKKSFLQANQSSGNKFFSGQDRVYNNTIKYVIYKIQIN